MDSRPVYLGIPGIHKMEGRVIGIANFKVKGASCCHLLLLGRR